MIDELETLQEANRRRLGVILRATGQTPAAELNTPVQEQGAGEQ